MDAMAKGRNQAMWGQREGQREGTDANFPQLAFAASAIIEAIVWRLNSEIVQV